MMAQLTHSRVREHAHIGMSITISTNDESISLTVSSVINQFSLGTKLFVIPNNGWTNLAICKEIFVSSFDNKVVFDLRRNMFVVELLANVLANACKVVGMDMKLDNGKVGTEVTRNNIQLCIT